MESDHLMKEAVGEFLNNCNQNEQDHTYYNINKNYGEGPGNEFCCC